MNQEASIREAKAHGKLLFFGEHAAVHGYSAVGASLPWTLEVQYCPDADSGWMISGILPQEEPALLLLIERMSEKHELLGWSRPTPGRLHIQSQLPAGAGFGSSGALCAALARVLSPRAVHEEIWEIAHDGEVLFHGSPSGIDTGLALEKGLLAFGPRPPRLPSCRFLAGFPMTLIVGALRREGETRTLVASLGARLKSGDSLIRNRVTQLGVIAEKAIELLDTSSQDFLIDRLGRESSHIQTLGFLAGKAQEILCELGLSTPGLDNLIDTALSYGSLGGKVSGAGGGGAFFLIFEDNRAAEAALKGLRAERIWKNLDFVRAPAILTWRGGTLSDD